MKKQIKILSITASPEEENPILYEKEQDTLLEMFKDFERDKVFLDIPDPVRSTMEEIALHLENGRHDILHITAHGKLNKAGEGVLAFEDEWGELKEVTGAELAKHLKELQRAHDFNLSIVILSSCHSARQGFDQKPTAESLHEAGIPVVIGMKESISHLAAIDFNQGFLQALINGKNVKQSFEAGLEAIEEGEEQRMNDTQNWSIMGEADKLCLLLNNEKLDLGDFNDFFIDAPGRPSSTDFTGAKYLERGFIGRRDILRNVYRRVEDRDGAVVFKGPGGIGKSTITTRVTAQLRVKGYDFIILPCETSPESILEKIKQKFCWGIRQNIPGELGCTRAGEAFLHISEGAFSKEPSAHRRQEDRDQAEEIYTSDIELSQKLDWFLDNYLLKEKLVLIFDNFEENQDEGKNGKMVNERLANFLKYFRDSLCKKGKGSVLFFSTRYHIPGFEDFTIDIPEFSLVECRKMSWSLETLDRLLEKSKERLVQEIGGNPRALELLNSIAGKAFAGRAFTLEDFKELIPELRRRIIEKKSADDNFTPLYLGKLVEYLDVEGLGLLEAVSLYRIPVVKDAMEVQGVNVSRVDRLKLEELSLLEYRPDSGLYYVHRLTANYILGGMAKEKREEGHRRAAGYFAGLKNKEGEISLNDGMEARWHYLQAGEWDEAAELTFGLENFLTLRGFPQLSMEILEEIESKPVSEKNRALLYHPKGNLHLHFGEYDRALALYEKSLEIAQKIGDIKGEAQSLLNMGAIYQEKGEYDRVLALYEKSLEIKKKIGDIKGEAQSLHQVGNVYYLKGEYDRALALYEKSLEIRKKIGDIKGEASSLHQVGMIYQYKGEYDRALAYYEQSLEIKKKIGDIKGEAISLHEVGRIYEEKGEYDRALALYEKSLEIARKIGDIQGMAISFSQMGNLHKKLENYPQALRYFLQAQTIFAKIGSPHAQQAAGLISSIREKIPPEEFEAILKEFGIVEKEEEENN